MAETKAIALWGQELHVKFSGRIDPDNRAASRDAPMKPRAGCLHSYQQYSYQQTSHVRATGSWDGTECVDMEGSPEKTKAWEG